MTNSAAQAKLPSVYIFGHSHLAAIRRAVMKHQLKWALVRHLSDEVRLQNDIAEILKTFIQTETPGAQRPETHLVLSWRGNENTTLGICNHPRPFDFHCPHAPDLPFDVSHKKAQALPYAQIESILTERVGILQGLADLAQQFPQKLSILETPPPIGDQAFITSHASTYAEIINKRGLAPSHLRLKLWLTRRHLVQTRCRELGIDYIPAPAESMDDEGYLRSHYYHTDPTHANDAYGLLVLRQLADNFGLSINTEVTQNGST